MRMTASIVAFNSGGDRLHARVAAEVRAHMGRQQRTQTDLAAVLGITQTSVSRKVRGRISFTLDELEILADYLHTSVVALIAGPEPFPPVGPPGLEPGTYGLKVGALLDGDPNVIPCDVIDLFPRRLQFGFAPVVAA